jgi:DNA-binding NtrC family response regulator
MIPIRTKKTVVLIVDDEQGMRDMLSWRLGQLDFEVHVAADGEAAAELLRREDVDLVITDVTMPRLNGLQLLDVVARLRPGAAIIMMTGFGTVETAVYAMRKGACDFLLKPFDVDRLMSRVVEVIAEAAAEGMPS